MSPSHRSEKSKGIALITGLVLLVILTLVALSTMRSTTLEYRMSGNTAFLAQARQVSESGRLAVSTVLHDHVFERSWSGVQLPPGLTILDKDSSGSADALIANESGEAFDQSDPVGSLTQDATFTDPISGHTTKVAVYHMTTKLSPGSGSAMSAGYMGLGKGAAGGGSRMFFDVLADGAGDANSRFVTSADVRVPVGY
ncbi:PilX N-terminal domain-containing pilus assembly protein [Thiorhodococcus minor]|uniref:Type 4 fimbrial biogenesis protein PilX N-terminal domain-containing protein n=1 Tax=Thiorhodococcus minor TaxID=57489 RepID=A0A6M0K6D4_9GAMM|nr:PilX N-terminal domain-containing pilus assembly protein [Thiorhodococcus minor]NEV65009.1 hypothetical protein [Thiorhodococcus minor]